MSHDDGELQAVVQKQAFDLARRAEFAFMNDERGISLPEDEWDERFGDYKRACERDGWLLGGARYWQSS